MFEYETVLLDFSLFKVSLETGAIFKTVYANLFAGLIPGLFKGNKESSKDDKEQHSMVRIENCKFSRKLKKGLRRLHIVAINLLRIDRL